MSKQKYLLFLFICFFSFGQGQSLVLKYGKENIRASYWSTKNSLLGHFQNHYYLNRSHFPEQILYKFDNDHNLKDSLVVKNKFIDINKTNSIEFGKNIYAYYAFENETEKSLNLDLVKLNGEKIGNPVNLIHLPLEKGQTTNFYSSIVVNLLSEKNMNFRYCKIATDKSGTHLAVSTLLKTKEKKSCKLLTWIFNKDLELIQKITNNFDTEPHNLFLIDSKISNAGKVFILLGKKEKSENSPFDFHFELHRIDSEQKTEKVKIEITGGKDFPRDAKVDYSEDKVFTISGFSSSASNKYHYSGIYFNQYDDQFQPISNHHYNLKKEDIAKIKTSNVIDMERGLNYNCFFMASLDVIDDQILFAAEGKAAAIGRYGFKEILLASLKVSSNQTKIEVINREYSTLRGSINRAHSFKTHIYKNHFFLFYPEKVYNKDLETNQSVCHLNVFDADFNLKYSYQFNDESSNPININARFIKFSNNYLDFVLPTGLASNKYTPSFIKLEELLE